MGREVIWCSSWNRANGSRMDFVIMTAKLGSFSPEKWDLSFGPDVFCVDHGNVMPICSVVMLCYIRADRLAECYLVLLSIKAIVGPVRKQTVSLGRLAYLSFWACLRIVSDLSRGCANIWRVFWRESRYGQDRYKTVSILGPVQTHISCIDRLEIGTNARPCWPNATMLFLCYYYYFFFLISGRLYFSHLFGIFARAHNAATVQIAGDNSDSDNESCLES